jgi:hypothetical protein
VAGKRQRRDRVDRKYADLEHLNTRFEPRAVDQPRPVCDSNHAGCVPLGHVVDANQRRQLDGGADLFHALPHGRVGRMFVIVDESAG